MADDPLLTGPQIAGRLGVQASTWRSYVARGQAPAPDDPDLDQPPERRTPRWRWSAVDQWNRERRGQAWRKGVGAAGRGAST